MDWEVCCWRGVEMSAPSSSSIGGIDQSHLLCLRLIELVEVGVYRVELLSEDGSTLSTISRVSEVDVGGGGGNSRNQL